MSQRWRKDREIVEEISRDITEYTVPLEASDMMGTATESQADRDRIHTSSNVNLFNSEGDNSNLICFNLLLSCPPNYKREGEERSRGEENRGQGEDPSPRYKHPSP